MTHYIVNPTNRYLAASDNRFATSAQAARLIGAVAESGRRHISGQPDRLNSPLRRMHA